MADVKTEVSGVSVGVLAIGALLIWSAVRGASVVAGLQEIIRGKRPSGENANPITVSIPTASDAVATGAAAGAGVPVSNNAIYQMAITVANSPAGKRNYCWGGGHIANPCSANCFDCSGYVSCVLGRLGLMKGSMVTGGFMVWSGATTIPYSQRQPGDIIVNAGHMGIIADKTRMWNAACTACGPVKLSSYVGRRGYIIRRVKGR
jgi:cell wall-associated NlpC family hydrolase